MLMQRYFEGMKDVLARVEETQQEALEQAAQAIVDSLSNGGIWHLLDTGHMLMYEGVGRTGGLMAVRPVRVSLEVSNPTRYREADKTKKQAYMDSIEGLPAFIVNKSNIQPGDILMIGSVSGINILPVEMAVFAREKGVKVIGLTAVDYSSYLASAHPSGKRLFEVCDIVLDNGSNVGDTVVEVEELGIGICPSSGIAAAYLMWALQARVVELFLAQGKKPSIYVSNHMPNASAHNGAAWAAYEKAGY